MKEKTTSVDSRTVVDTTFKKILTRTVRTHIRGTHETFIILLSSTVLLSILVLQQQNKE